MNKLSLVAAALSACLMCNTLNAAQTSDDKPQWTLNMQNAELRDLVGEVGKITGKTIVIDPNLNGRVTVQAQAAMSKEDIYSLFLSVLRRQGFTAIDQGDRTVIVPVDKAKTMASSATPDEAEAFVTRIIDLHNTSANDVASVVRPLVAPDAYIAPAIGSNALVVSDNASNVERIREVVQQLDSAGHKEMVTLKLQHAWAADVAKSLSESVSQGSNGINAAKAISDVRSNRVILVGPEPAVRQMQQLASTLDVPGDASDNTRVVRLHHSDAKQLETLLTGIGKRLGATTPGKENAGQDGGILISADESQNALVIMADPAQLAMFDKIIAQLDRPRAQVLVEAAIVEVSGDITDALGVQWAGRSGHAVTGFDGSGDGMSIGSLIQGIAGSALPNLPSGAVIGIGDQNFGALISALSKNSNNNLLSTPSLLTLDNEPAEILVGQNVPFETGSYTTDASGVSNPFTTVERKDIGITLKVTPHINEGNTLRLKIEQESSELVAAPAGITTSDVITNKRLVKSTILADNGQVIVLGGLIKDNIKEVRSKVPLLGDIPLIGGLFRSTREVKEKTNLMVFLRPTLLRTSENMDGVSRKQYNRLDNLPAGKSQPNSLLIHKDPRSLFEDSEDSVVDMRGKR